MDAGGCRGPGRDLSAPCLSSSSQHGTCRDGWGLFSEAAHANLKASHGCQWPYRCQWLGGPWWHSEPQEEGTLQISVNQGRDVASQSTGFLCARMLTVQFFYMSVHCDISTLMLVTMAASAPSPSTHRMGPMMGPMSHSTAMASTHRMGPRLRSKNVQRRGLTLTARGAHTDSERGPHPHTTGGLRAPNQSLRIAKEAQGGGGHGTGL